MAQNGSNKKVANGLVAVSCGAVLAVYTAGYVRTRAAVDQFEAQAAERRAADPVPQRLDAPMPTLRPPAPAPPAFAEAASSDPARIAVGTPSSIAPAEVAAPESAHEPVHPVTTASVSEGTAPSTVPSTAPSTVETPALAVAVAAAPAAVQSFVPSPAPPAGHKVEAVAAPPAARAWKDGTYYGWGTSRHGDIQAQVVVEGGRISATISQCRTRYPCSVIEQLPPEVAQRQSPDVDYVSRATQSANAFYFAVVDALSKAK
jgi:uncharacterized protein with FMN-binding domain